MVTLSYPLNTDRAEGRPLGPARPDGPNVHPDGEREVVEHNQWQRCAKRLEGELSAQMFNTWIRPLQAMEDQGQITLLAPNPFVLDWVRNNFLARIVVLLQELSDGEPPTVELAVGTRRSRLGPVVGNGHGSRTAERSNHDQRCPSNLNDSFTFENFVEGKSNQLARAAAIQVSESAGEAYNPLLMYGGSGLGKTHLMHAIGNSMLSVRPSSKVVYLHSERFVSDMVKALQHNAMNEFKRHYRTANALLIDDIQFFAGTERTQEEFFHTFNALLDSRQQIILTCDRYPREVTGLEDRLKSRFGWGLTVAVEPPDLETRVAILMSKAIEAGVDVPDEVAFFVAKRIRSNVRELEGALKRLIANQRFTGRAITLDFAKEALSDLIAVQAKMVTIENIQKVVAAYYKIRVSDMVSNKRSRSIARPRQMAMRLTKALTSHSLPEIGMAFGGRDHTTVLHACRKIDQLRDSDPKIAEDYANLLRTLSN